MLREWRIWVRKIYSVARELVADAEIYVIGSIVRGDYVGGSDVDILIVSPHIPEKPVEKGRIKTLIENKLKLPYYHPFQIHLVKPHEARLYLKRAGKHIVKIT